MTLDELARWMSWVNAQSFDRAGQFRVTPAIRYELERLITDRAPLNPYWPIGGPPGRYSPPDLFGIAVVVDETLPRGVWRLCDRDGTLLRDCREGRTLREIQAMR